MSTNAMKLPPFVLHHLDAIALSEGLKTYTIEYDAGSKHGDGFMSNMLAITLTAADQRLSLICKLQLPQSESADALDSTSVFEREVEMYQTVLPLMEKLQRNNGLTPETGFFAYPKCYLAVRADNNESIIVLEDLRASRYALWDKFRHMPFENVSLLLKQLGRYNAMSFVLRDQQPQVFAKLETMEDTLPIAFTTNATMRGMFVSAIEQAILVVDEEKDKALLRSMEANWLELLQTRRNPERLQRFGVLIHGDCHINNMMFTTKNGIADSIVIIDWQTPCVASPVTDVANFLFWCTDKSLRDQHFDQLLRIYHDELTRVINVCGSDAAALFSFDDLLDQMREFTINAVVMSPMAVSFMVTEPKDMKTIAELTDCAGDDLNSRMLAPLNESTEKRYKSRLLDIFNDARRLGYVTKYENQ